VPLFDAGEYEGRVERTRGAMQRQGVDVLIVTDPANVNYLTGYDAWSFYTPQGVVVPAAGEILLFGREMDAKDAHRITHLRPEQVLAFPEHYVQHRERHAMEWVGQQLHRAGVGGRVALEMDSYYFTPRACDALRASMPGARFTDAQELVNWVRAVKSPAELTMMRRAAVIAERAMRTAVDVIRPGVRQCDAAAEIAAAQARGTEEFGGDYPAIVPMLPTGEGTSMPHLTWSEAPFQRGEATVIELAGCYQRYHCPLARTVFLGSPPDRLVRTTEIVREGLQQALAAVKPGATCESVEQAWREVISREGLKKASRIGYSVGVGYPPDWGEHTMSLRAGDTSVLAPNMAFHMILGMWMDGWGMELSETFVVTEDGAECLTNFPRQLFVTA
jgi:ectoine hydrolase